jgi:hypothetical protein
MGFCGGSASDLRKIAARSDFFGLTASGYFRVSWIPFVGHPTNGIGHAAAPKHVTGRESVVNLELDQFISCGSLEHPSESLDLLGSPIGGTTLRRWSLPELLSEQGGRIRDTRMPQSSNSARIPSLHPFHLTSWATIRSACP